MRQKSGCLKHQCNIFLAPLQWSFSFLAVCLGLFFNTCWLGLPDFAACSQGWSFAVSSSPTRILSQMDSLPVYPVSKPSKQELMYFLWEEEEFGKKDQNTCKYTDQSISKNRWEKFCVIIQVQQEGTGCKSEWGSFCQCFLDTPLFRIPIKWLSSS